MEEEINVEIEKHSPSIEHTLRPIFYTAWILGAGPARPRKWSKIVTFILRFVNFVICSVIVAYGAIDFFTFGSVFKSDIFKIMYYMNKVVCYVSSYYYVYHGIRHYEKWPELMRRIKDVHEKIKREAPMNDRSIRFGQIFALIAVVALGPFSLITHALYYYFILPKNIFTSDLLLYYTITQALITNFVFDMIVFVLRRLFVTINSLIERLDDQHAPAWITLKIRRIRELHSDVCSIVILVNEIHGIQLLLSSANSFTMVVATLFRIYMGVVEHNYEFMFINNIIWIIYTAQFALNCWVSTLACRESNRTGVLIHTIVLNYKRPSSLDRTSATKYENSVNEAMFNSEENEQFPRQPITAYRFNVNYFALESLLRTNHEKDCVRNEVNDFSSQLQQTRVSFSACDFFEMNNALLNSFVGVITTYLIILVQFYRPEHQDPGQSETELTVKEITRRELYGYIKDSTEYNINEKLKPKIKKK